MRSKTNNPNLTCIDRATLAKEYYSWLCYLTNVTKSGKSYWLLTKKLHRSPFRWIVPNDDNRAFDGKLLRERFCDTHGIDYNYNDFSEDCSMLELLIGIAYRCEDIMADQGDSEPMVKWYWDMLDNAGLSRFTDDEYHVLNGKEKVDRIIESIINRTYHRNGKGGLFPLKHYKKDQRKVELWYQMSTYLVENYYTEDCLV